MQQKQTKKLGTYIGACGFQSGEQVMEVWKVLPGFDESTPQFMVGAMTSHKILHDKPTKHASVYPSVTTLKDIFSVRDCRIVNSVHYANYDADRGFHLCAELSSVVDLCGPNMKALQLDMIWPDPAELEAFKKKCPDIDLILQIGRDAMYMHNEDPIKIAHEVKHYVGIISHVLIDASGGEGYAIDLPGVEGYIDGICNLTSELQFTVAGALGPKTVWRVAELVKRYGVSIDAQSQLTKSGRPGDHLDVDVTKLYIQRAKSLYPSKKRVMA